MKELGMFDKEGHINVDVSIALFSKGEDPVFVSFFFLYISKTSNKIKNINYFICNISIGYGSSARMQRSPGRRWL